MKLLNNKLVVILLSALIVVSSFFVFGLKKQNAKATKVLSVYTIGEEADGICIQNDLEVREDCAMNVVSLADKYLSSANTPSIGAVKSLVAQMKNETSKVELAKLNDNLTAELNILADHVREAELTDSNRQSLEEQMSIFTNKGNTILYDNYNVYVQEYLKNLNDPLSHFFSLFSQKVEYFRP